MKLTKDVQIAIALITTLRHNPILKLETVATMKGVSRHFLEQVSRKLRVAGIIKSHRGPKGGYSLIQDKITVGEIMKALDRKPTEDVLSNSLHIQQSINGLLKTIHV